MGSEVELSLEGSIEAEEARAPSESAENKLMQKWLVMYDDDLSFYTFTATNNK